MTRHEILERLKEKLDVIDIVNPVIANRLLNEFYVRVCEEATLAKIRIARNPERLGPPVENKS